MQAKCRFEKSDSDERLLPASLLGLLRWSLLLFDFVQGHLQKKVWWGGGSQFITESETLREAGFIWGFG